MYASSTARHGSLCSFRSAFSRNEPASPGCRRFCSSRTMNGCCSTATCRSREWPDYTAADRCRSSETSTADNLTNSHPKLHLDLHLIDGHGQRDVHSTDWQRVNALFVAARPDEN